MIMYYMNKLKNDWERKGFTFALIVSVFILVGLYICNRNNEGTYDLNNIFYIEQKKKKIPKTSKGEQICRNYLENRFKRPFPNVRPNFMFNPETKSNLELDMFNSDLKLACEYNGRQHYQFDAYMHRNNYNNFTQQQKRDKTKIGICKRLGIDLISVPYTVSHTKIPQFLDAELAKLGYK